VTQDQFKRSSVYLQLGERETTTSSNTTIVFDGGAADNWAEFVYWARCNSCSFGETSITATKFAAGLFNKISSRVIDHGANAGHLRERL
jgi:hypothetical protein